jgi:hypothetical protein
MKTLKFTKELVWLVLSGERATTFRLFDDKDLQIGDKIALVNKEVMSVFANTIIVNVIKWSLRDLIEDDYKGHEKCGEYA